MNKLIVFVPSQPCFEAFFLLHFVELMDLDLTGDETIVALKEHIQNDDKSLDVFPRLDGTNEIASARLRALMKPCRIRGTITIPDLIELLKKSESQRAKNAKNPLAVMKLRGVVQPTPSFPIQDGPRSFLISGLFVSSNPLRIAAIDDDPTFLKGVGGIGKTKKAKIIGERPERVFRRRPFARPRKSRRRGHRTNWLSAGSICN
jgi:hypothetical protein